MKRIERDALVQSISECIRDVVGAPVAATVAELVADLPELRPLIAEPIEYLPDDGVEYWVATSEVLVHRYKVHPPFSKRPVAWCGSRLVKRIRRRVGQGVCSRCERSYATNEKRGEE